VQASVSAPQWSSQGAKEQLKLCVLSGLTLACQLDLFSLPPRIRRATSSLLFVSHQMTHNIPRVQLSLERVGLRYVPRISSGACVD
jgi:hypothetical protein